MPYLAPDATALGQIFWYTVETDPKNPIDSGRLWALNKFYIGPQLNSAPGVADVAIVGGTPLEYQIDVRPEELRAYGITLAELYSAVAQSNMPAGGGVVQKNNAEYIVRGVGWIKDKGDIENTVIKEVKGVPIYVKTIATVQLGTQFRRSVYEKDRKRRDRRRSAYASWRESAGCDRAREGKDSRATVWSCQRVSISCRLRPHTADPRCDSHPHGSHDARDDHCVAGDSLDSHAFSQRLRDLRDTAAVGAVFLPDDVDPAAALGIIDIQANIMSLAGITISIGILVDQAIVMTENATHHLKAHFGDQKVTGDIRELVIAPCRTVGRPIFFSVLIMLLSFIPVFMLSGREGKLFHPSGIHEKLCHDRCGNHLDNRCSGTYSHIYQGPTAQ